MSKLLIGDLAWVALPLKELMIGSSQDKQGRPDIEIFAGPE